MTIKQDNDRNRIQEIMKKNTKEALAVKFNCLINQEKVSEFWVLDTWGKKYLKKVKLGEI